MSNFLYRYVFVILYLSLFLTPAVARDSHWRDLDRSSKRFGNTDVEDGVTGKLNSPRYLLTSKLGGK
jgi:hypothetical protein